MPSVPYTAEQRRSYGVLLLLMALLAGLAYSRLLTHNRPKIIGFGPPSPPRSFDTLKKSKSRLHGAGLSNEDFMLQSLWKVPQGPNPVDESPPTPPKFISVGSGASNWWRIPNWRNPLDTSLATPPKSISLKSTSKVFDSYNPAKKMAATPPTFQRKLVEKSPSSPRSIPKRTVLDLRGNTEDQTPSKRPRFGSTGSGSTVGSDHVDESSSSLEEISSFPSADGSEQSV